MAKYVFLKNSFLRIFRISKVFFHYLKCFFMYQYKKIRSFRSFFLAQYNFMYLSLIVEHILLNAHFVQLLKIRKI